MFTGYQHGKRHHQCPKSFRSTKLVGQQEADAAAKIRSYLHSVGQPIGAYDLLIAATAQTGGFIMVTANEREFRRIEGLEVENWRGPID
ncbi:MAG: PIN domain-containing protein [Bacteroidota bacterium]